MRANLRFPLSALYLAAMISIGLSCRPTPPLPLDGQPGIAPPSKIVPDLEQIRKNWPNQFCTPLSAGAGTVCHENPKLGAFNLNAVSAISTTSAWIVGENGAIWHSNGQPNDFRLAYQETGVNLEAVYAVNEDEAWAVGSTSDDNGIILTWDGIAWNSYEGACPKNPSEYCSAEKVRQQLIGISLHAVHGSQGGSIWIVGQEIRPNPTAGVVYQALGLHDVHSISLKAPPLYGVFAFSDQEVWAVGSGGTILNFRGGEWIASASNTKVWLDCIWGSSPSNIWVGGESGTILHWDGTKWQASTLAAFGTLTRLWGTSPDNIWAATNISLWHWNGAGWMEVPISVNLLVVGGKNGLSDMWAVGYGAVFHGPRLEAALSLNKISNNLGNVWGSSASDIWATAYDGAIVHYNGSTWNNVPSFTDTLFTGIWGSGANDVWAVGFANGTSFSRVYHWNGSTWNFAVAVSGHLAGIWGSSQGHMWLANSDSPQQWNGTFVTAPSFSARYWLTSISGTGRDDIWATGYGGIIIHWDGSSWSAAPNGDASDLYNIWASGPSNIWAVGAKGTILHGNGAAWTKNSSNTNQTLRSIWGSDPNNVWAVGDEGTIVHFDGTTWTVFVSGSRSLNGVWGSSSGNVWIVGSNGAILSIHNR